MSDTPQPDEAPVQAQTAPAGGGESDTIEGTVERIVFTNPENFYTVAVLREAHSRREVTIVGNIAGLRPEEVMRARGGWIFDRKYGRQFRVDAYDQVLPDTATAMERYLASGLIKGIGSTFAKRLIARFGTEIFDIIEKKPGRLKEVDGIGPKRLGLISAGWKEHRILRDIIMFLQQQGISTAFGARIYRQYGDAAIDVVTRNPYQLALDVRGIGFKTADGIAQKLGVPVESIERAKAGVFYLLQELAGDGHCFAPADDLIQLATETLGVETALIVEAMNALARENHAVLEILPDETRAVYLRNLHMHEGNAARCLVRLARSPKRLPAIDALEAMAAFEKEFHFSLAPQQREAIAQALAGGVLVITGGPGTGKTTIIKAIIRILAAHGVSVLLAAPTGRAAKRMQELTHTYASTLHRLLKFSPKEGRYQHNSSNPLKGDFVIVDEASMIDISLADALVRAVPASSSLVLVGDRDQLPSVGPGSVLGDLMASGVVPVVRLNEVFRQAQHSLIITNAHRINSGEAPFLPGPAEERKHDMLFVEAEDPETVLAKVKDLVKREIPRRLGHIPPGEVQVITPMHRGVIGAQNLNRELQALLNPKGATLQRGPMLLRTGDKVMQVENDYDKDVFNGDIGFVSAISGEDQSVQVDFDGRTVSYDFNELDELELAYAVTVHKSQGSEYRVVVIPMHTTHYVMLQRNLLYTGVTRGRKLVCLVGQKKAIMLAIRNANSKPRKSALDQRLQRQSQAWEERGTHPRSDREPDNVTHNPEHFNDLPQGFTE